MDAMLLFAAAAALAMSPNHGRPAPAAVAEATASVRIVAGVRLKLDSPQNEGAPRAHDSKVKTNGQLQPARLIEFE
jgi:hypothetical protein